MGFEEFKKAQKKQDETEFVKEEEKAKSFKDERLWSFTADKTGNASAIIRFLPQKDPSKPPYQKLFQHSVQNKANGRWLIDECPWTIKVSCPICKYASEVYSQDSSFAKKTWYVTNILVVKDELNPEAEGKVFLWKFGKEIFKIIESAIKGNEEKEIEPKKVFNFLEGHDFKLKVYKKSIPGFDNPVNKYDESFFVKNPSEIYEGDDKKQEFVYDSIYSLDEFIDPKRFKTEEELQRKLSNFLNVGSSNEQKESTPQSKPDSNQSPPKENKMKETPKQEDDDDDFFNDLDNYDDIPF
jgi:hypothetical protein